MGEYIPVVSSSGNVDMFISVGADFFAIFRANSPLDVYFWLTPDRAYSISDFIDDKLYIHFNSTQLYLLNYLDLTPSVFGYVAYDLDEYVLELRKRVGEKIHGKKILLSYSGGKDSNASLVILKRLQDYIDFDLYTVYVHMPFLDSENKIDEAIKIANSVGVDVIVLEADRSVIERRILEEGYPHRGFRWCTFQKIKPIRRFKREYNIDYEVINDRAFETFKRLMSLIEYAKQRIFISGKKFRPIYPLTFLDVLKINKDYNLIHSNYEKGFTRVSCTLCPYRTILELDYDEVKQIKEKPSPFDLLKNEYYRFYSSLVGYDTFLKYGVWRYGEFQTKEITALREFLVSKIGKLKSFDRNVIVSYLSSPWRNPLPVAKRFSVDSILERIVTTYNKSFFGVYMD